MPGSKDVRFNRRTMAPLSAPDKVQQLVLNVKEHLPSVAPQNVAATLLRTGPKRIQQ